VPRQIPCAALSRSNRAGSRFCIGRISPTGRIPAGDGTKRRTSARSGCATTSRPLRREQSSGLYLLYSAVVIDEDGTTHFFDDIYEHEARLDAVLAKGPPYSYPTAAPMTVKAEAKSE
jgi:hypothetical protein